MIRAFLFLLILLTPASSAFAQSYVAGSVGTTTTLQTEVEFANQPTRDLGTAFTVAARAGLGLGSNWGAELEVSRALDVSASGATSRGLFDSPLPGLVSIPGPGRQPINAQYQIRTTTSQHVTRISPTLWYSRPMTGSIDLVLLTGASFDRTVSDAQTEIRAPNSILALLAIPASTHVVNHHVGLVAGVETRLAFGTHFRVMPGVRLHGTSGGWAVRPAVAAGWFF